MATVDTGASEGSRRIARALAIPLRLAARFTNLLEPWLLLATRVWLAQAFLILQVSMLMSGRGLSATLAETWWIDTFRQVASSGWGSAIQALCPVLLILGLTVRPAALLLIIQVVLLQHRVETALHSFWILLLVCLFVRGAGRISLAALFAQGLAASALPGARFVVATRDWMDRRGTPILLLSLRAIVAVVILVGSGQSPKMTPAMHAAMAMLPPPPGVAAALPAPIVVLGTLALVLGVGVRAVAALLIVLAPLGSATIASDTLYWVLLLGFLVIDGAGVLAFDPWLDDRLRRMIPAPSAKAHRVVIIGGGFGGCAVANGLAGRDCNVTLLDQHNYHLFQPLLYQVATAGLSPADIATPIRGMFRTYGNIRVRLAKVTGIDKDAKGVKTGDGRIPYDTLVIATGARHAYFGNDEWAAHAPGLKTVDDATAVRRRLLSAFEAAEATEDEAERAAWLTFVIVGGGPTGVELAGAIAELARYGMAGDFRLIDPTTARVVLVHSGARLLAAFPIDLSAEAAAALGALGVEVMLDSRATRIDEMGVTTANTFISSRSLATTA